MASQVEHIKWVANKFMVDGFAFSNSRCKHYFLTHFHSDHTIGLTRGFNSGIIYCTQVTKNLLHKDFKLTPSCQIEVLDYEQPVMVQGVQVTALPANHCPGACMLLFQVPCTGNMSEPEVILHTGDFRWQTCMLDCNALRSLTVTTLYLDTTYAVPRYRLPPQEHCILAMVEAMKGVLQEEPATLFVIAAYRIGKEKVFLGAARLLGCKVWVSPAKRSVLQLLDLPAEDWALLADTPEAAQLHVVSWGMKPESLQRYLHTGADADDDDTPEAAAAGEQAQALQLQDNMSAAPQQEADGHESAAVQARALELDDVATPLPQPGAGSKTPHWKKVVGIKATGWTLRKGGKVHVWAAGPVSLMSVPYSEHSSWDELCDCVRSLRPKRLVPTVNVETTLKYKAMQDKFAHLMDLRGDKSRILFYMSKGGAQPHAQRAVTVTGAECTHTSHKEGTIDLSLSGSSREEALEPDALPCDAAVSSFRELPEENQEEGFTDVGCLQQQPEVSKAMRAPATSGQVAPAPEASVVDLSHIDVQEQLRIYTSIMSRQQQQQQQAASRSQQHEAQALVQSSSGTALAGQEPVQGQGQAGGGTEQSRKRKLGSTQQQQQQQQVQGVKKQASKAVHPAAGSWPRQAGSSQSIKAFFHQAVKP